MGNRGAIGCDIVSIWLKLLDAREFEDVTNMLSLPIWPFYGMMVAGMGLCVFVMVLQIAVILMTGEEMK